jgi:hypothetical protein
MPEAATPPEDLLLSAEEVRRRLATGEVPTVLDARGRAAYARSPMRVAGDLRVTGKDVAAWTEGLRRDAWLLAYCT